MVVTGNNHPTIVAQVMRNNRPRIRLVRVYVCYKEKERLFNQWRLWALHDHDKCIRTRKQIQNSYFEEFEEEWAQNEAECVDLWKVTDEAATTALINRMYNGFKPLDDSKMEEDSTDAE
ncbi:hypothetical protein HanIR_Chr02g0053161 [Helianthus annuus]|nr:hypothetical protein HanIR_Chr02g0053161 [Helianthus annuus]